MEIIQDIVVQELSTHTINTSSLDFINRVMNNIMKSLTFSCVIYCIKYFTRLYLKTMFSTAEVLLIYYSSLYIKYFPQ